jgi:biotin carboxylase
MKRVLLFTSTTGYQARSFEDAASALGIELIYATDRCHRLEDPWRDGAIAVNFSDVQQSASEVSDAAERRGIHGVLAIGDRPALLAAHVARALGIRWHSPGGARAAQDKLLARGRMLAAALPVPWFVAIEPGQRAGSVADRVRFPCVVKPARLSASRGVMRADTPQQLDTALDRLCRLLENPDVVREAGPDGSQIVIEGFIPGREYALEGVVDNGALHVMAIFEKPDPLDGPFFEETIYVTPPRLSEMVQRAVARTIAQAARALDLYHGPIHAECRVTEGNVFVLEIAARPIGGLCARSLRFVSRSSVRVSLEEVLLRHAVGDSLDGYAREARASGVMMIPVPGRGHFRRAEGIDEARCVPGILDVVITAKAGQLLEPWPEGHSYPGFIFAGGTSPEDVVTALRNAHHRLRWQLDTALPMASC